MIVGVVFHEAGRALAAFGHLPEHRAKRAGFVIALAAKADALAKHALGGKAGQLLHAVEIFEGIGIRADAVRGHELIQRDLIARLLPDGVQIVGFDVVRRFVFGDFSLQLRVGHGAHELYQVADAVVVHFPAEADLAFHAVAVGHGHLAHVGAEHRDFQLFGEIQRFGDLRQTA